MTRPREPEDLFDVPDPFADEARSAGPPLDVAALPPAPTRAATRTLRLIALAAALAFEGAALAMMGPRDRGSIAPIALAVGVGLPIAFAAAALLAARGASSRRAPLAAALLGALAFVGASLGSHGQGDPSVRAMVGCVLAGGMLAAAPAVLAVASFRRAFAFGATWRTAALGLACGLAGAATLRLVCPNDALGHLLASHGAPVLLVTVAVGALGVRLTRA